MKCSIILASLLLMLTSCVHKESLPKNPQDKQEYIDSNGNRWIYNYALMRWAMTSSGGGVPYYYYPSTSKWTNSSGITVSQPSSVKPSVTSPARPANTGKSFGSSRSSSMSS